ncbi:MAG: hypothetical protein LUC48_00365 [Clostridiales bacterium]|nr:hypothetical protein [Clostridiales bacterium]
MNKHRLTLLLTACVTALNLTLAAALTPQAESADLSPAAAPVATEADSGGYLLLAVDGKVCVYQDGALLMRTEIDVSLLPAADRADLAAGIHAADAFALAAYLEDFGA